MTIAINLEQQWGRGEKGISYWKFIYLDYVYKSKR